MFIKNCLTPCSQIKPIEVDSSIRKAISHLRTLRLDTIPVVDSAQSFAGITGYSYIMKYLLEQEDAHIDHHKWDQPISAALHPIRPLHILDDFEDTLPYCTRYPFVPVVEEDGETFAGIVKIGDIEKALTSTYGHEVEGVRFLLGVFIDMPHQLEQLMNAIKPFDVNIIAIASFDAGESYIRRILLKVKSTPHIQEMEHALERKGFRVLNIKHQ
ncbi:hypothetical protein [Mechercharimyces sp. CAU 1602]|uniref:hypothetical protein n=1 Tax=Mechercharimyces sp. CAU 1602 TaxID=2973933 RepID=UPI0021630099|nr:hypothetical protein [Mechercharimyces sp. CAU 1602]MCS1352004.1 hypothetical protein [Mechercharimyces sp. CAU 1602]